MRSFTMRPSRCAAASGVALVCLAAGLAPAGCSPRADVVADLPSTDGGGPVRRAPPDGATGTAAVTWDDGGKICGGTSPVLYHPKTPDVLIAFDRSGSMRTRFGTGTRLSVELAILRDLVRRFEPRIRWAYEEFPMNTAQRTCPGGAACCADLVTVEPALGNFAAIDRALLACSTAGSCSETRINTPTWDALRIAREFYAGLNDGIRERYVLLSTDGEPNCTPGMDACGATEEEVRKLLGAGIKTIVLGVSEEVQASACLNRLAQAGGAPRTGGPPFYYPGSDPDLLKTYLEQIVGMLATPTCFFDLSDRPPDPSRVAVFFDRMQVPHDPGRRDGWDYDGPVRGARIAVHGSYCARLQGFNVSRVDIRFGCPPCEFGMDSAGRCAPLIE